MTSFSTPFIVSRLVMVAALSWGLFMTGCAAKPFTRAPLPPLPQGDARAMVAAYAQSLPDKLISDDTVIIQAPFRDDLAILSVLKLDRHLGTLELLGMNHMGLRLFHLAHDGHEPVIRFAVPPLMEQEEVLLSIARDTRLIYFDLLPLPDAKVKRSATTLTFTSPTAQGTLVHTYAGQPLRLIEKRLKGPGLTGTRWHIEYYTPPAPRKFPPEAPPEAPPGGSPRTSEASGVPDDGQGNDSGGDSGGNLHGKLPGGPGETSGGGVVLENGKYHYRIIIRNRSWRTP